MLECLKCTCTVDLNTAPVLLDGGWGWGTEVCGVWLLGALFLLLP